MAPTIKAMRAITGAYFQKLLSLVGIVAGGSMIILFVLTIYLSLQVSGWWSLLFILLVPLTLVGIAIFLLLRWLSSKLIPGKLNTEQRKELLSFSDTLFAMRDKATTPLPITIFLIAKDVVRNKQSTYLSQTIDDSRVLREAFVRIKDSY